MTNREMEKEADLIRRYWTDPNARSRDEWNAKVAECMRQLNTLPQTRPGQPKTVEQFLGHKPTAHDVPLLMAHGFLGEDYLKMSGPERADSRRQARIEQQEQADLSGLYD